LTFTEAVADVTGREINDAPITAAEFATGMIQQGAPRDFALALAERLSDSPQRVHAAERGLNALQPSAGARRAAGE
jgi:hypothetical protein